MIDFHKRFTKQTVIIDEVKHNEREYKLSKMYTLFWGIFCIIVAQLVVGMGSLIEAVNVLGSLFYGVILGIFLVGFYMKRIQGNAVFIGAIIGELVTILLFILDKNGTIGLGFLWLNVVGALLVVVLSWVIQFVQGNFTSSK
jgi:Na+/proline symporter